MSARTPGPWVADEGDGDDWGIFDEPIGDGIAYCFEPNGQRLPNAKANAAFIIMACNAHDELVAALRLARECIAYCRRAHKDAQSGQGIPAEVIIDAALAKVQP